MILDHLDKRATALEKGGAVPEFVELGVAAWNEYREAIETSLREKGVALPPSFSILRGDMTVSDHRVGLVVDCAKEPKFADVVPRGKGPVWVRNLRKWTKLEGC